MNQSVATIQSIGIEVHGGRAVAMIPAATRIPAARAMTFTTVADGQRAVEVRVVRCGPAGRPAGIVGRFLLSGLRAGEKGRARIDIGVSLDREGVIRAWASERASGAHEEAMFAGAWALTPEARPEAAAALSRRLDAELAEPGLPDAAPLRAENRIIRDASQDPSRSIFQRVGDLVTALSAIAGEIDSVRRSSREPAVAAQAGERQGGAGEKVRDAD